MLRFLADENFNGNIVRGVRRRQPRVDLVRIQQTEADGAKDPAVLAWAAKENRIVLTHDRATMPDFAYSRVADGEPMPGVSSWMTGSELAALLMICYCLMSAWRRRNWPGKSSIFH
jgi:predicted nuclease of predicted toxin-antitoxin system